MVAPLRLSLPLHPSLHESRIFFHGELSLQLARLPALHSQAPADSLLPRSSADLALLSLHPLDFSWLSGWQVFSTLLCLLRSVFNLYSLKLSPFPPQRRNEPQAPRCLPGLSGPRYHRRRGHRLQERALSHLGNERMERSCQQRKQQEHSHSIDAARTTYLHSVLWLRLKNVKNVPFPV